MLTELIGLWIATLLVVLVVLFGIFMDRGNKGTYGPWSAVTLLALYPALFLVTLAVGITVHYWIGLDNFSEFAHITISGIVFILGSMASVRFLKWLHI